MKTRHLLAALALGVALFSTGCGYTTIQPGNVGVVVHKYGGDKGVDVDTIGVGAHWFNPMTTDIYTFSTAMQNYVWTANANEGSSQDESISFQTKEGLSINGDFGITYEVEPDKVAILYQKYREGIREITNVFIRNNVRDALNKAASTMSVEDVIGEGKAKLLDAATDAVVSQVGPLGIHVDKVYLIGTFRLPDVVQKSVDSKIAAQQQALQKHMEVDLSVAEGQKIMAIAHAQAQANREKSASITPQLIAMAKIEKWDGHLPMVTGGSAMIDARSLQAAAVKDDGDDK